jgi:preprotein translocase SecE subunit
MNKATGGAQQPRDGGKKKSALSRSVTTASRQPGNRASGQDFVRGVVLELKRVTWPTRDEWVSATVLTVALVVGIGLFTFLCDQLFGWIFNLIHPLNIK